MKQKFTLLLFLFFSLAYSQTSGFDVEEKERIIKKLVASIIEISVLMLCFTLSG